MNITCHRHQNYTQLSLQPLCPSDSSPLPMSQPPGYGTLLVCIPLRGVSRLHTSFVFPLFSSKLEAVYISFQPQPRLRHRRIVRTSALPRYSTLNSSARAHCALSRKHMNGCCTVAPRMVDLAVPLWYRMRHGCMWCPCIVRHSSGLIGPS